MSKVGYDIEKSAQLFAEKMKKKSNMKTEKMKTEKMKTEKN